MPIKQFKQHYGRRYHYIVVALLVIVGLSFFSARLLLSKEIRILGGDTIWQITMDVVVPEDNKGGRLIISPPLNTRHIRLVTQSLRHPGMNQLRTARTDSSKRNIVLASRTSAQHRVWIEFNAQLRASAGKSRRTEKETSLTEAQRERYLKLDEYIDAVSPELSGIYRLLSEDVDTNQDLPERLYSYTNKRLIKSDDPEFDNAEQALRARKATTLGRARALVALVRTANVPARVVTGFILEDAIQAQPYYWVEVYMDGNWHPYDPERGYAGDLPPNYLPFNKLGQPVISPENIEGLLTNYSIHRNYSIAGLHLDESKTLMSIFDLERFEPDTRRVLSVLLLMPFGVLITAIFRNIIGIRAYGTFTSTFLALAAVYADWITAVLLLVLIVAVGVSGRTFMPDKMERIPRLGIIFIIVMMSMLFAVSLMDYLDLSPSGHVFLLPMIILTTLIDRFYSAAEQYSLAVALRRVIWTFLIALFCYAIMIQNWLGEWLLGYPELHFITMAVFLFIACYKGPTLGKLSGFEWLKEPAGKKKTKSTTEETP